MESAADWGSDSVGDPRVVIRFNLEPKQNEERSRVEGRPIFEDLEYVEIMVPGDRNNIVHRPVRPEDRQKYARQYAAFKGGQGEALSGTPLAEWPGISRSEVAELAHFNIRSVEQLATVGDGHLQRMGPLLALRQRARDFIEKAKGNAPLEQMRAELATRDNLIATQQVQLDELKRLVAEISKGKADTVANVVDPKRGKGR